VKTFLVPAFLILFILNLQAQINGQYWNGISRLELKEDKSYNYSWGWCIAPYSEQGNYYLSKDTIIFHRVFSHCSDEDSHYVDSNAYRLNEQNIFVIETYRVLHYNNTRSCKDDTLTQILYYSDGELFSKKSRGNPCHIGQYPSFTSKPQMEREYWKLESDALLLFLTQELSN
jgi:hypothetical protein